MRIYILSILLIAANGYGFDLVKDGKSLVSIVVDAPLPAPDAKQGKKGTARGGAHFAADDAYAATVLADWLEKMTSVRLAIVSAAPQDGPAIYVGSAAVKAGLKLDQIQSETREGLRIFADQQKLMIAGQNGYSTVKAVCRFLEELGCRYFMDQPLGEVYPHTSTLSVGALDISEAPGMLHRHAKGPSWRGPSQQLWSVWNGEGSTELGHAHSWSGYIPDSLGAAHPEYFAMKADGTRAARGWLCTSNEDVRNLFAEKVLAAIRSGRKNPSISPTDGRGYCCCPNCKAQDDPAVLEPSSGTVSISKRYLNFFNAVGEKIKAGAPDSILSFYCYADYTQPPAGQKAASNLCAFIAPIRYCRLHGMNNPNCPSRQQEREMIEGWAGIAGRIGYYAYNYDLAESTVPLSLWSVWKHDIPYLKNKGCIGITIETLSNWQIYGPQIYLALRLAYAPSADADAIMEDYFMKFYGPKAGPLMKQYWKCIDDAQANVRCHSGSFFAVHLIYTPELLAKCKSLLTQAGQAAGEDKQYTARVALHAEGFKSAEEYIAIFNAINAGRFVEAKAMYETMASRLELLGKAHLANPEYATAYLRRFILPAIDAGAKALTAPNSLVAVLPDEWRLAYEEKTPGVELGWQKKEFDDSNWRKVLTYSATLDAQGMPDNLAMMWYRTGFTVPEKFDKLELVFTRVDGDAEVFVNGVSVGTSAKKNVPFSVDVTKAVTAGLNTVSLRVDHTRMTELFVGGIVRPVILVEKK